MHLKYFVFCGLDKSNLYFVIEIQLECILCNFKIHFCVKYLKSLKITLQLVVFSSIWF